MMFTAFTSRRLSLASLEEVRPTPTRPCLPATSAGHSARKPPLGKALQGSRGERCEHGAAQGPGTLMEQFADLRLLAPPKNAPCADDWHRNSLRFGREMLGTLEQQGQGALGKRRRSLGGRLQSSVSVHNETEDMLGDLGHNQLVEAGWGEHDSRQWALPPLHGFHMHNSGRSSAGQNPFATPRRVRRPRAGWQVTGLGERQPQTVRTKHAKLHASSGPAQLTLGGGLTGNVDAVDIGGLKNVLGPEERVAWQAFAPLQVGCPSQCMAGIALGHKASSSPGHIWGSLLCVHGRFAFVPLMNLGANVLQ